MSVSKSRSTGVLDLDELDWRILIELTRDSRQSLRSLAKKLKVSISTISSRVRRLEKCGIIKGYTVVVDYEKLGLDLTAIIEITISRGQLLAVEREIAAMPGVFAVYDVTGLTDAIAIARVRNRKELNDLVKGILSMEYVERTNTRVVLNTVKEDFNAILRELYESSSLS